MKPLQAVVSDFDSIADVLAQRPPRSEADFTSPEEWLLRQVPPNASRALDVGCGAGDLSRALATRRIHTVGIDVSPRMIERARASAGGNPRLEYRVADIMNDEIPETFDLVVSVAVLHHLPLEQVIPRLMAAVAPGGTLLIQDVTSRRGLRGLPRNGLAWFARHLSERPRDRPLQTLYDAHGVGEEYLSEFDVTTVYHRLLPTARIHLHLEWRYTAVWRNNPV